MTDHSRLIVLMMVKLDMTVDQCIEQYKILSEEIFSKQRSLLKRVFGDWSKFLGEELQKAVEDLLSSVGQEHALKLRSKTQQNNMRG